MTKKEQQDSNLHIALVGITMSILATVVGLAVYFTKIDSKVDNNGDDIREIKTSVHDININIQGMRNELYQHKYHNQQKMIIPETVIGSK